MFSIVRFNEIFVWWLDSLHDFWDILITPISYTLEPLVISFPPFAFLGGILKLTGFYDLTLLEFMLTVGLTLYVTYQLFIWILNLIT